MTGGEFQVENTVGPQTALPASEQGVYTCWIPLQSGVLREVNIGVYPIGFSGELLHLLTICIMRNISRITHELLIQNTLPTSSWITSALSRIAMGLASIEYLHVSVMCTVFPHIKASLK